MIITHEIINSAILVLLAVGFFTQNSILKYMKTAMEALDPQKLKQAQDFINEGKDHEYKLKLSQKVKEITKHTGDRIQQVNETFYSQYNELLNIVIGILSKMNWEEREKHLTSYYPKNADTLREILTAWDNGEFDKYK